MKLYLQINILLVLLLFIGCAQRTYFPIYSESSDSTEERPIGKIENK